jgi:hypothetical protein
MLIRQKKLKENVQWGLIKIWIRKYFNIETETVTVIKNKKTGYIYKDEEELKAANVDPNDISRDTLVKVTNKGLEMFKRFMSEK